MTAVTASPGAEVPSRLLSPLAAALMALVGVFAFSALIVLFAYAPDLRSGDDGAAQPLSRSAIGFAGLVEALRLSGEPVVINRAPLQAGRQSGLLIVTPTPSTDLGAIEALTFDGPVLVVAPKWLTGPDPRRRGWVKKAGLIDFGDGPGKSLWSRLGLARRREVSRPVLQGLGDPYPKGMTLRAGPTASLQTLAAPGWAPVIRDETGRIVMAQAPNKRLFVLADPDLLNTQGVADIDTLATALSLVRGLRSGDGPMIFDVRLNGLGRERSVLRLLFDPPFLAVTLCLSAAAGLAGFQAFCRFGAPRSSGRVIALGKTALVDNTAALIRLAGREPRMGGRYADLTAALAARSVGAPRGLGGDALVAVLDRLSAARRLPETLSELSIEARLALTTPRLGQAALRLYRWRLAMTGRRAGPTDSPDAAADSGLPPTPAP